MIAGRLYQLYEPLAVYGSDLADMDLRWYRQTIRLSRRDGYGDGVCRDRGRDGGHYSDRAVTIPYIILNDESRPSLLDFVASRGVKFNEVDFTPSRNLHERIFLADRFNLREPSNRVQASSSSGNHSAAIARSWSAFAR